MSSGPRPSSVDTGLSCGTQGAVWTLGFAVVIGAILAVVYAAQVPPGSDYTPLIALGLATVAGVIAGVVGLIGAFVDYGRSHKGTHVAGVVVGSVAALAVGGFLILQLASLGTR